MALIKVLLSKEQGSCHRGSVFSPIGKPKLKNSEYDQEISQTAEKPVAL